ncbi:MAG: hypothetical protein M1826_004259 [Phylliscum demangeonii]|nr:MAG: hypothetical protein M1826_004259 [Phylliscum demangeonii]
MASAGEGQVFAGTYSNVPVYEYFADGHQIMRRRSDNWVNATHILKAAEFQKPARTRILEREVHTGPHEKVQGGYGKYQGTWIPLEAGRDLATRNGVYEKLRPIFEFEPGDQTPPPAPRQPTAASTRPRAPRRARKSAAAAPPSNQVTDVEDGDEMEALQAVEDEDEDGALASQQEMRPRSGGSGVELPAVNGEPELSHLMYGDRLMDYFEGLRGQSPGEELRSPSPPPGFPINTGITRLGHTALHLAASTAHMPMVETFLGLGADVNRPTMNGETALMWAVQFRNNYDRRTMPAMTRALRRSIHCLDHAGQTVFHHAANQCEIAHQVEWARYYLETISHELAQVYSSQQLSGMLDVANDRGDTALLIVARHGAKKCVRTLIGRGASSHIANAIGQTAEEFILQMNRKKPDARPPRDPRHRPASALDFGSSSPPFPPFLHLDPHRNGTGPGTGTGTGALVGSRAAMVAAPRPYRSQVAERLVKEVAPSIATRLQKMADAYENEMAEREADLAESQRVKESLQLELAEIDQERARLEQQETDEHDSDQSAAEEADLARLEHTYHDMVEHEQTCTLQELALKKDDDGEGGKASMLPSTSNAIAAAAVSSSASISHASKPLDVAADADADADADPAAVASEKLRLATALYREQTRRRGLVADLVTAQSMADLSQAQPQYRQLLAKAIGVGPEEADALLPVIWQDLETGNQARERERESERRRTTHDALTAVVVAGDEDEAGVEAGVGARAGAGVVTDRAGVRIGIGI